MIGSQIGPYRIVSKLGEGGMGEVYRAHDAKLGRDVAIKLLPPEFAKDPDRRSRFEREARLLAALHHPHIATIFGVEDSTGVLAIVMEVVEGPTLAERIAKGGSQGTDGKGLPVAEALAIARQLAEALDVAHEKGIVHRDLKPANIKLTVDGQVKVLDFGLATAVASAAGEASVIATQLVSQPGNIVGTAAYMSPEQARGQAVDKRTDIWAFGCVLFEMLTGKRAFAGETASDVMAKILEREPEWNALPVNIAPAVRRLLERCLEKDLKRRLRDIGDAVREIDDAPAGSTMRAATAGEKGRGIATWMAVVLLSIAVTGVTVWNVRPAVPPTTSVPSIARLLVVPPEPLPIATEGALTLSADGRRIAYVAGREGHYRLYVRGIEQFESKPIPGTEGADSPRFSPDGQWLAFVADRKLKKVALAGGVPATVAEFTEGRGLTWESNDSILFNQGRASGIWRVSAAGGTPAVVTTLAAGENEHNFPEVLPDGQAFFFSANVGAGVSGRYQIFVQSLRTGQRHPIGTGVVVAYLPTGHLIYLQGGTLYAAPFDPGRLEITGAAQAVIPDVSETAFGGPLLSVAPTGAVAYVEAGRGARRDALVWVNRNGVEQGAPVTGTGYSQPRLAPDGRHVAVTVSSGGALPGGSPGDVWVYDFMREAWSRSTFDGRNQFPLWTPDGRRLAFSSSKAGSWDIYLKSIDAGAAEERLFHGIDGTNYPLSWSPDGQVLAFVSVNPTTANDIWVLGRGDNGKARPLIRTKFREGAPAFSPDGRWIAYASDSSGRTEIYMRPSSGAGEEWTISNDGGNEPLWAHDTGQLFYRHDDSVMVVDVTSGSPVVVSKPRRLFDGRYRRSPGFWANYDVAPDGQRLLMVKTIDEAPAPTEIHVVLNWLEELRHLATTAPAK